jgi:hypothetical protein
MLDYSTICAVLTHEGFSQTNETKKLARFDRVHETVYVKRNTLTHRVIAHSKHGSNLSRLLSISGVTRAKSASQHYHNANMGAFDSRLNLGRQPTKYGFDFEFDDAVAFRAFLSAL